MTFSHAAREGNLKRNSFYLDLAASPVLTRCTPRASTGYRPRPSLACRVDLNVERTH